MKSVTLSVMVQRALLIREEDGEGCCWWLLRSQSGRGRFFDFFLLGFVTEARRITWPPDVGDRGFFFRSALDDGDASCVNRRGGEVDGMPAERT